MMTLMEAEAAHACVCVCVCEGRAAAKFGAFFFFLPRLTTPHGPKQHAARNDQAGWTLHGARRRRLHVCRATCHARGR